MTAPRAGAPPGRRSGPGDTTPQGRPNVVALPDATTTNTGSIAQPVLPDGSLNPQLFPELAVIERGVERFDFGYDFGYEVGYDAGYRAAEVEMDEAWAELAEWVRQQAYDPSYCTLMQRRAQHPAGPCRDPWCSVWRPA